MTTISGAAGYRLTSAGGPLRLDELDPLTPAPDEVVVEVAGCGLCHTDLGFAYGGVPTRKPLPLILGHEISGRVAAAGEGAASWIGRSVVVPAVIPCGDCDACNAGRPTICRRQFMPGNDGDGGFATHVVVPSRGLCPVPDTLPAGTTLAMLSVVADAVTTPYEAIRRANVGANDLAIFVGAGGVGGFGVQIAAALGATVVAIDVDPSRLELMSNHGAALTLNAREMNPKELKNAVRVHAKQTGKGRTGWKIFETSGTTAGQQTAFGLLDFGAELAIVGFTPEKVDVRLSNLMAFDAIARGNWGCDPANYPGALELVLAGKVAVAPFVESHPLSELPVVFEAAHHHRIRLRPVLVPHRIG
ncbi:MAG: 6-hydroxycyclohex-1-ene-1-carbonyl-CoA dehydrogenase [Thermoanaerobaculia bacterium]|nr:6-hydroxycyclohex-1-ene-1-carbonyl-CoA dehydrogenase [Thermoanaerobaculia bacterium]